MALVLIYVTCADEEEAAAIARALLDERLVSCANIFPAHRALYRWDGKIEDTRECAVIFKTQAALFPALEKAVCARHSYECPCIVALPVTAGHDPFLRWIEAQTGG